MHVYIIACIQQPIRRQFGRWRRLRVPADTEISSIIIHQSCNLHPPACLAHRLPRSHSPSLFPSRRPPLSRPTRDLSVLGNAPATPKRAARTVERRIVVKRERIFCFFVSASRERNEKKRKAKSSECDLQTKNLREKNLTSLFISPRPPSPPLARRSRASSCGSAQGRRPGNRRRSGP